MYCKYNYNPNCTRCTHFVRTEKIIGDDSQIVLVIPERPLCNCASLCICLSQLIPKKVGKDSILKIQIGTEQYLVGTPNGNYIYGDQLCNGKYYCFKFGTDTLAFIYRGGWRLCKTKHVFNCVPIPTLPAKNIHAKSTPQHNLKNKEGSK